MRSKISLQEADGVARCLVKVAGGEVVALLSEATWRARFGPGDSAASFKELLLAHQRLIESVVARKAASTLSAKVVLLPDDL